MAAGSGRGGILGTANGTGQTGVASEGRCVTVVFESQGVYLC